ncbi:putative ribonuclease H-like domain-containing protein [Tanacetum coccineum]
MLHILNTIDHLGKFDGKADEGFFVGYSTNSKAFRVFNSRTRIVEENLHVKFSEETPNIAGNGPNWLFDIISFFFLSKSYEYEPVVAGNQSNGIAGIKECENAGKAREETVSGKDYILLPFLTQDSPFSSSLKDSPDAGFKPSGEEEKKDAKDPENEDNEVPNTEEPRVNQEQCKYNYIQTCLIGRDCLFNDDEGFDAKADLRIWIQHIIMDVKSAFLYGKIEEKVYVCQPPGFENPEFPNKVYKVEKALYGLHQVTTKVRGDLDNSRDDQQDGKDKLVKSSTLIGSLMPRDDDFYIGITHTSNTSCHIKGLPAWQSVCLANDPMTQIHPPMIDGMYGCD